MKTRILAWLVALALTVSPCMASQNNLYIDPTNPTSGLALMADYNNAFLSLAGCNSGASAPNNLQAGVVLGQCWIDTSVTPNAYRINDGAGNWLPVARIDATNHILLPPIGGGLGTLTAGTTTDLGSVPQSFVSIAGTTTITSFGSSAIPGSLHIGTFSGALTLTYNAVSMILAGGNNIATAAGDSFIAAYLGGGNWQIIEYARASLATKSSPAATDYVVIQDAAAGNAPKKSLVSQLLSLVGTVTSIASNTGAFTLSEGIKNSTNVIKADPLYFKGYLSGLILSTAGESATFGVSIGAAVDNAQTGFMQLASAYTKTTSAWGVGSGNGALDTGTISNNTWYQVYLIKRPDTGVVDIAVSLSAAAPTTGGAIPSAYTVSRRIGAMLVDSGGHWTAFTQVVDDFLLAAATNDGFTTSGTAATTQTLSGVPTGIVVKALMRVACNNLSTFGVIFTSLLENDVAPNQSAGVGDLFNLGTVGNSAGANIERFTNSSGQIRVRGSASGLGVTIFTYGWKDTRGK